MLAVSQGWRGPAPAGRAAGGCADRYGAGRALLPDCQLARAAARFLCARSTGRRTTRGSASTCAGRTAPAPLNASSWRQAGAYPAGLHFWPQWQTVACSRDHTPGTANCAASTPAKRSYAAASSPSGLSTTHNCAHIVLTLRGSRRTLLSVQLPLLLCAASTSGRAEEQEHSILTSFRLLAAGNKQARVLFVWGSCTCNVCAWQRRRLAA